MYSRIRRTCGVCALFALFISTGCTELYFTFGPGGLFGPSSSSVGGSTTTQPTVIDSPVYVTDRADPLLESTAGAKVVVAAQLNDDNGDGVIDANDEQDFVSGSNESQPIQIHLNNGNGTSFTTITVAGGGPIARMVDLEIADLDADGRDDIAVLVNDTGFVPVTGANLRGAVVLLFNPPDASDALAWEESTISATFILPCDEIGMTDFAVGDLNGDNLPDIALGSNEVGDVEKHIRLYLNPGAASARNGNLWAQQNSITVDAVPFKKMQLADVDGDGDLDLFASFPIAKTFNIRWLVNPLVPAGAAAVAAGNWQSRIVGQQGEVDPENVGGDFMAAEDIDGDGDFDVAVAHAQLGLVQWFRNPARPAEPGGFAIVTQQTFPWEVYNLGRLNEGFTLNQMQLVNLDSNGTLDCFVTANGNMVGFTRGPVLEDFWLAFSIVSTNPVADIGTCAITDINEDGLVDIIAPLDREGLVQDQIIVLRRVSP